MNGVEHLRPQVYGVHALQEVPLADLAAPLAERPPTPAAVVLPGQGQPRRPRGRPLGPARERGEVADVAVVVVEEEVVGAVLGAAGGWSKNVQYFIRFIRLGTVGKA